MLQSLRNRKKGQNTAEYAILIALVIGAVVAMQSYAQRALQGRVRDASITLASATHELGNTKQYEPYYTNTSTTATRSSNSVDTYANQARNTESRVTEETDQTDYTAPGDGDL